MIKKTLIIILVLSFLIIPLKTSAQSAIRTVYKSGDYINVYTKQGKHVVLSFESSISYASVGNNSFFSVKKDNQQDKLIITPQKKGVETDLIVFTKDSGEYAFTLVEDKEYPANTLVKVKSNAKLSDKDKINIVRGETTNIKNDIIDLFTLYDVNDFSVDIKELIVSVEKGASIKNINQTIYWLKLRNVTDKNIRIKSIGIKNRKLETIVTRNYEKYIGNTDSADFFLITEGKDIGSKLEIKISYLGKVKEVKLSNIPFTENEYNMYELGG